MKNAMCLTKLVLVLCAAFCITGCDDETKDAFRSIVNEVTETPSVHVQKAMKLLLEYHNIRADRINRILDSMDNNSSFLDAVAAGRAISEAQADYVQNTQRIDISDCPADFQAKFNTYLQSEIKMLNMLANVTHPNSLEELFQALTEMGFGGNQKAAENEIARQALFDLVEQKYDYKITVE